MRSLCLLPGGLGRFVTCSIGANHCRLRHTGWEKCGHGLTSRPRESASVHFLDELLGLFRCPPGSGRATLAGTLPLRYCAARFACRTSTWRLPGSCHVVDQVTASVGAVVEDLGELAPFVQILDLPVPQLVDNVLDALRIPERPMAVQVIEVPKILIDVIPCRSLVLEPQTAEQLPTVLSPTRIALQIAEQLVDTPVPQGRGGNRRVQGFLSEQSTTAQIVEQLVDMPFSGGGLLCSLPGQSTTARTVEQIVDIPSSGGGLGQDSASSAGPADEDFTVFFFSHFSPMEKKCGVLGRW